MLQKRNKFLISGTVYYTATDIKIFVGTMAEREQHWACLAPHYLLALMRL